MTFEPLMSVEQVSTVLGISPWTLRKYLREGRLPSIHVGSRVLLEPAAVQNFIDRNRSSQSTDTEAVV